jgi:hypothetical protein
MKSAKVFLAVFTIWTYGSEPLDILAARTEWDTFAATLQCETRDNAVWCKVDGVWETIENRRLSAPWGIQ